LPQLSISQASALLENLGEFRVRLLALIKEQ